MVARSLCRVSPLATPVFLLLLASPVLAAEHADCTCRSRDGDIPVGGKVCLPSQEGWRVAQCVMEVNVTSWRPTGEACGPISFRLDRHHPS